jgi:hypothetical protein
VETGGGLVSIKPVRKKSTCNPLKIKFFYPSLFQIHLNPGKAWAAIEKRQMEETQGATYSAVSDK